MLVNDELRKLTIAAGLIGIVGASMSGCGGGGGSSPGGGGGGARSVCNANAHTAGQKRWTVLVYMNAANDLQPDSLFNIAQMAAVGSDASNLNLVVQWKQANCNLGQGLTCGNPSFIGTRRYLITQHSAQQVSQ
ncbi:MAG TPA: hypothetical protein VGS41_18025, partial [Chthonomonadales bacterium]|nr:hypothetical protein [Chthonomonadales bacterium]